MWSYYGAKTNIVDLYPAPKHQTIIEPFAGSARYALKYFDRQVILWDKSELIANLWLWLQKCSKNDILSLPRLKHGEVFSDYKFDCEEARHLVSFVHGCGDASIRNKPTARKTIERPNHANYNYKRIASLLYRIRHWQIHHGSYQEIENIVATWFIDPPYEFGGHAYPESNRKINFKELGAWCMECRGQVIVCENTKATWLPFIPLVLQRGSLKSTTEAIWCNEPTAYDNIQTKILF